jgi:uncharacterized protein (DUF4415 family)
MKPRTGLGPKVRVVRLSASDGGKTGSSTTVAAGKDSGSDRLLESRRGRHQKKRVTMFLDADVLAWFKGQGRRYQSEINQVLRTVMMREKERGE